MEEEVVVSAAEATVPTSIYQTSAGQYSQYQSIKLHSYSKNYIKSILLLPSQIINQVSYNLQIDKKP